MLTPVRCLTCALEIGHVAPLFRRARAALMDEACAERGLDPELSAGDLSLQIDCKSLFDALGFGEDRACCCITLATTMDLRDLY